MIYLRRGVFTVLLLGFTMHELSAFATQGSAEFSKDEILFSCSNSANLTLELINNGLSGTYYRDGESRQKIPMSDSHQSFTIQFTEIASCYQAAGELYQSMDLEQPIMVYYQIDSSSKHWQGYRNSTYQCGFSGHPMIGRIPKYCDKKVEVNYVRKTEEATLSVEEFDFKSTVFKDFMNE